MGWLILFLYCSIYAAFGYVDHSLEVLFSASVKLSLASPTSGESFLSQPRSLVLASVHTLICSRRSSELVLTTPHSQLQLNVSTRKSQADSEHPNLSSCSITLKTCDSSCPAQVIKCRDCLLHFSNQKPVHPLTFSALPTIMCHQPPCVLSPGQVAPFPQALAPHSSPSS